MTDDALGAVNETPTVEDAPLGDPVEEAPDVVDITGDVTPEDFDFDEFVAGVRPGRRAVRVTMRADLVGELDQILIEADKLSEPNGEEAQELMERFEKIKAQIAASQRTFVVEARSDHRRRQIEKTLEKLGHQKPGKKASEEDHYDWNREMSLHVLADAIVVPSNISVEGLRKLNQVADAEVNKLFGAFSDASSNPTKNLDPNFLHRR